MYGNPLFYSVMLGKGLRRIAALGKRVRSLDRLRLGVKGSNTQAMLVNTFVMIRLKEFIEFNFGVANLVESHLFK